MLDDMGAVERKVFRHYWNDGQLDLFAAVGITLIGAFWLRDLPVAAAIVPALLVPFWGSFRQRFVEPRLGMVEFTEKREQRNRRILRAVLYFGIAMLVLGVELYLFRDSLPAEPAIGLIAGLPAVLLAILAVFTALMVNSIRFLAYALVLVLGGVTGGLLGWPPGLILLVSGLLILLAAIATFARFVSANPADGGSVE